MNRFEKGTLILQGATLAVGLGVILQIYLSTVSITDTSYEASIAWILDLDKTLVDKPELQPYFYGNVSITPADKNYAEASYMAEYMLDTFDAFLSHRFVSRKLPVQQSWENWMFYCFDHSPILRDYMLKHADWYNQEGALYDTVYKKWLETQPGGSSPQPISAQPGPVLP